MMHLLKRKETYAATIFVALLSVSILLPGKQWSTKIGTLVQALAVSALVGVTIFYANQTKRLVDESIKDREEMVKKRNADFWERTIIEFYRPLINKINNLSDFLRMKQIATDELNKVTEDVLEF
jgi:hypothetical protein